MKVDYAEQYGALHSRGKYFPGKSIGPYVDAIAELVEAHSPTSLLDFGCGRGIQYLGQRVHERWGGLLPHCYDIGVNGLNQLPDRTFDGVICTDVLEHIHRDDVPEVLSQIFGCVAPGGFVFLGISCRPSKKKLPNKMDAHLTVEPPSWWIAEITEAMRASGKEQSVVQVAAHWDIAGHFDEPETPWAYR